MTSSYPFFRSSRNRTVVWALLGVGQCVGLLLVTERPARAYVDPGSGLLTLQMLGASIAGGFFMLRHRLRKLLSGDKLHERAHSEDFPSPRTPNDQSPSTPRSDT